MAFFLAPRFAPAYAPQCGAWSCGPTRSSSRRPRISRPSVSSFMPFLQGIDELLTDIDREARHQAHRERQQRKRIIRAHFNVHENEGGYQIDGEIPGFEQNLLDIEVTDDNTIRIAGDTEKNVQQAQAEATTAQVDGSETETQKDVSEAVSIEKSDESLARAASPSQSDTASHKSFNATVEDDFEDLGADAASVAPKEAKGKEVAVDESSTEQPIVQQQAEPTSNEEPNYAEDRFYGSFERTFRFPERIDASSIKASLKNGLLSVTVPKAKAPEVKRITIQ